MTGRHLVASSLPVSSWLFILTGCQQPQYDRDSETIGKAFRRNGFFSTLHHWPPVRRYADSSASPICLVRQHPGSEAGGICVWVNCLSILYVPRRNTLDVFTSLECFELHENAGAKSGAPILQVSQTSIIFIRNIFNPCLG